MFGHWYSESSYAANLSATIFINGKPGGAAGGGEVSSIKIILRLADVYNTLRFTFSAYGLDAVGDNKRELRMGCLSYRFGCDGEAAKPCKEVREASGGVE